MNQETAPKLRDGYRIYIDTLCQGPVPVVSDGDDKHVVFETELEIVDNQMTRLQQCLDGERDYEDAMTVEEFVVPVTVHQGGTITDEAGNCFGPSVQWEAEPNLRRACRCQKQPWTKMAVLYFGRTISGVTKR